MRLPVLVLSVLAACAATSPAVAATATATDPRIEHLLAELGKVRDVQAVQLSPDGAHLAWVVEDNGHEAIHLAAADGSGARLLEPSHEHARCSETDIAWAPDSRRIAYLSDCATDARGQKDVHVADIDVAGAVHSHRMARLHGVAQALRWSGDGKALLFLYVENGTRRASALAAAKPQTGEVGVEGLEVQRVAWLAEDGTTPQLLTPADRYVYEFALAPDNRQLAYVGAPAPGDNNWWIAKLYAQSVEAGAASRVLVDPAVAGTPLHGLQLALPRWSPDGRRIAFIGGLMSDQGNTGGDIYAVPAQGGNAIDLTRGSHVTPVWLQWTGAEAMLVGQLRNGHSEVADYVLQGDRASEQAVRFRVPASIGAGDADMALSLSRDFKRVAYVESSYSAAPEVHAGLLAGGAAPAVTAINAALKPSWGRAESVEWEHGGFHVQGWLLFPAHYDAGRRYPMIVSVHGGPASAKVPAWPGVGFGPVPFSALDYFVFMPNPRGSYGQGEAFVQANRKDFGYGDLDDILAGVDAVEKQYPVDDARLGLTGWSYGGFMSMFAPTRTNRFRAVVAGAGISNWQSYYGQNLIDQWMTPYFGASVYDDPAVYAKSSAINYIKQIKAPTLVVVGDRDAECPAPQSFEFWHALRAQGVPTSLVVYPDEGHRFVDPAHQRDVLQRALGWFVKYLPEGGSGARMGQRGSAPDSDAVP
jgi:dipeptidyl aminopeptidase/acylaminoacyl peptidase